MSSCPISGESVDERAARIVGALVVVSAVAYLLSGWFVWLWLVSFDFAARVFRCDWSLFGWVAKRIRQRYFAPSFIDAAPKMFAARLGLAMAVTALLLHGIGWIAAAQVVIVFLLIAATLESALGFCLGCWLYGMIRVFDRPGALK